MERTNQPDDNTASADPRRGIGEAMNGTRQFNLRSIWEFEAGIDEVAAIAFDTDTASLWCGDVLMELRTVAAPNGFGVGHHVAAHTKGFLPHSFAFSGVTRRYEPARLMVIDITGDFEGTATITLDSTGTRTLATFEWSVDCRHRLIRPLTLIAPNWFAWNHRWAMRRLGEAARREILRRRAGRNAFQVAKPTFPHNIALVRFISRRLRLPAGGRRIAVEQRAK
ncbi:MAG: hypothetical protein R3D45_10895 [Rhizobiaceae bacterium]